MPWIFSYGPVGQLQGSQIITSMKQKRGERDSKEEKHYVGLQSFFRKQIHWVLGSPQITPTPPPQPGKGQVLAVQRSPTFLSSPGANGESRRQGSSRQRHREPRQHGVSSPAEAAHGSQCPPFPAQSAPESSFLQGQTKTQLGISTLTPALRARTETPALAASD